MVAADCQAEIERVRQQIDSAHDRHTELQRSRVVLSDRNVAAASVLAELSRSASVGNEACAAWPARPQLQSNPTQASSGIAPLADLMCLESQTPPPRAADGSAPPGRPQFPAPLLPTSLLRQHKPPRIHAADTQERLRLPADFRHHAGISYDDLRNGSRQCSSSTGAGGGLLLLEDHRWRVASRTCGCHPQDVLWFMQMHKEVAPGLRLSFSSAVCSPECVASMAVHTIVIKLEAALLAAVLEQETGAIQSARRLFPTLSATCTCVTRPLHSQGMHTSAHACTCMHACMQAPAGWKGDPTNAPARYPHGQESSLECSSINASSGKAAVHVICIGHEAVAVLFCHYARDWVDAGFRH